jgi:LysR family transcriptional regulator, glycine cleavage system transcriptional activator
MSIRLQTASLNGIRAFEAAARHGSFTRAAVELCVSQGSISRHIISLEEATGVRLFERGFRKVELTSAGRLFFERVTEAFAILSAATHDLARDAEGVVLRVKSLHTLTARWLMPRLVDFRRLHPTVQVQITTTLDPFQDLRQDEFDVGICYRRGDWPACSADYLFGERLVVVSSPSLADGRPPPESPAGVADYGFLHSLNRPGEWRRWLDHFGLRDVSDRAGLKFSNSHLMYQAAIEGLGLAVAQTPFIREDVTAGRLVLPFREALSTTNGYFLIYPTNKIRSDAVMAFKDWILTEAVAMRDDRLLDATFTPPPS